MEDRLADGLKEVRGSSTGPRLYTAVPFFHVDLENDVANEQTQA